MAVITISREFGSGGIDIAHKVAQATGFHYAGKDVMRAVLAQYGVVEFADEYDSLPSFWEGFDAHRMERRDLMVDMLNRAIRGLARHGNVVILGRCGFAVLGGYADVLNVRVQAPLAHRIKWVLEQQQMAGPSEAEAAVKEADKVRSAFIEDFYHVGWDSARAFDLVLDTSKFSPELAVATIVEVAKGLAERREDDGRLTSSIEIHPVMAVAVASVLKCEMAHGA